MYYVNMRSDEYLFNSVERRDFITINSWLREQGQSIQIDRYKENFFAYYISTDEIFIKIENEGNIIGVFKGRVDFHNELVILFYLIDEVHRGKGVGKKALCEIIKYFENKGLIKYKVIVNARNERGIKFWVENGFLIKRRLERYFNDEDMLILEKINSDTITYSI